MDQNGQKPGGFPRKKVSPSLAFRKPLRLCCFSYKIHYLHTGTRSSRKCENLSEHNFRTEPIPRSDLLGNIGHSPAATYSLTLKTFLKEQKQKQKPSLLSLESTEENSWRNEEDPVEPRVPRRRSERGLGLMRVWGRARREGRATLSSALPVSCLLQLCVCARVCVVCLLCQSLWKTLKPNSQPTRLASSQPPPPCPGRTDGRMDGRMDGAPTVLTNGRGRRGSG